MKFPKWLPRVGMMMVLGSTLAGCCVVPVGPRGRYYGPTVAVSPPPVIVAPGWGGGWRH